MNRYHIGWSLSSSILRRQRPQHQQPSPYTLRDSTHSSNHRCCTSATNRKYDCNNSSSTCSIISTSTSCGKRYSHSDHQKITKISSSPLIIERTNWNITAPTTIVPNPLDAYSCTVSKRYFSQGGWTGARGYDLTNDVYDYDKDMGIPKVNVSGYDENGFVVKNMIQKIHSQSQTPQSNSHKKNSFVDIQNHSEADSDGSVYMNGSIIVYPTGCFLWNISPLRQQQQQPQKQLFQNTSTQSSSNKNGSHQPRIIPIESLSAIVLLRPHIEYLFIGCNDGYGSISNLNDIQYYFRHCVSTSSNGRIGIVVEQMQLYNAIGTFNLLNAEDRQVAAALIVDDTPS